MFTWIGDFLQFIVHHIKEIHMNAINTYLIAINDHIKGRIAIAEAQAKFVIAYNTMTRGEQGAARDAIAQRISERTGVKAVVMTKGANKGRLGFTSKQAGGSDKSEAARSMFVYYTPKVIVEKSSTTRKAVDPVSALLEKFQSLTAAQKRAFLKAV
jgi:hypothetical protein